MRAGVVRAASLQQGHFAAQACATRATSPIPDLAVILLRSKDCRHAVFSRVLPWPLPAHQRPQSATPPGHGLQHSSASEYDESA